MDAHRSTDAPDDVHGASQRRSLQDVPACQRVLACLLPLQSLKEESFALAGCRESGEALLSVSQPLESIFSYYFAFECPVYLALLDEWIWAVFVDLLTLRFFIGFIFVPATLPIGLGAIPIVLIFSLFEYILSCGIFSLFLVW